MRKLGNKGIIVVVIRDGKRVGRNGFYKNQTQTRFYIVNPNPNRTRKNSNYVNPNPNPSGFIRVRVNPKPEIHICLVKMKIQKFNNLEQKYYKVGKFESKL